MRGVRIVAAALAGMLSLPVLSACSSTQVAGGQLAPSNTVTVHVINQNFHDMDVFVVSQGVATRLGTVTGEESADFSVPPSLTAQDLRIIATPIGGAGQASTGPFTVSGGQTIDFRIAQLLSASSVFIR